MSPTQKQSPNQSSVGVAGRGLFALPEASSAATGYGRQLLVAFAVAGVYFISARLGFTLAFFHSSVSPVWPPTGVAIAAVLLLGYRISPAVFLGAFLANLSNGVPFAAAFGIATGNTIEAVSAGFLLNRFAGVQNPLDRAQDVVKFVLIGGILSPVFSATIGNVSLCLSGAAQWTNFTRLWLTWWLGDGSGALVVAPLLIAWALAGSETWPLRRVAEALLLVVLLACASLIVFGGLSAKVANYPLGSLTIPFLLWASFRFGPRGAASTITILSGIAAWGTTRGFGPFVEGDRNESLLLLQVFVVGLAITALILAAVVTQYQRAQNDITLLASIVSSTDDAVVGKTLDGTVVSWNKGAERIYGYLASEMIGRPVSILIPPEAADDLPDILERLKRGKTINHRETERIKKDGTRINVSLTISPIKNQSGEVIGASAIARDITDRKRAERELRDSEQQLRLALNAGKMGAWEYNVTTKEVKWSDNLEGIHGLAPGTFGGRFEDYIKDIHPEDRDRVQRTISNSLEQCAEHHVEYRIILPDGRVRWVEGNGRVISDAAGKAVRMAGVCTDISERKAAEIERERLLASESAARLEAEYATRLSEGLLRREQVARREAEAANRAKDEFLALVSHEVRTPLNAILVWADVLLDDSKRDEELIARALEVIKRNGALQAQIIDDILDVSRITAGKLRLEARPVEIASIIQGAIAAVQPLADTAGIRIDQQLEPISIQVSGDANRLQQIIWNLLSNAIKFTPRGGEVEVGLSESDSNVRITLKDTGEGISSEFLPRIFDRFRQADSSTTRRHRGLGLGLSIVQHLVELHGGKVEAHSAGRHQGSVFTVTLPGKSVRSELRGVRLRKDAVTDNPEITLSDVRVLIVDDDADSRDALATMLELQGAEVKAASSVGEALTTFNDWKPNVLVSDIGMPGEDGYDLIRNIRTRGAAEGGQIAAIALTGYATSQEAERALAAGYQLHMAKPVEPMQLVEIIAALESRRASGDR